MRKSFSMSSSLETFNLRDAIAIASLYLASYAIYAWLGVAFDASTLPRYMQFIDADLLSNRLLESLWYYHANPPFLNLIAGIGLKAFGSGAHAFFSVLFHALGLVTAASVYFLTLKLANSRIAASGVTCLLVLSPSFALYQNWFMYSFPAAAFLSVSAVLLYQFVRTGAVGWAVGFFGTLALLLLTRSLFHLVWMVAVAALLATALRSQWRQVLFAASIPILIVCLWYGKNYYLFGTFSSSTWFGLGLSNISTLAVTREELAPLVERGELSPFALVSRYQEIDRLFTSQQLTPTGIPVLDQIRKSSGDYNFNNLQLLMIDRYYTRDGFTVIKRFPASYVVGLIISNRLFFSPSNMNLYFNATNRAAVRPMEAIFNPLLYGVGARPGLIQQPHFGFTGQSFLEVNTSLLLIVAWLLLLGYGYARVRRAFLPEGCDDLPRAIVMGYIAFTMLYIYGVGTAFELAENYRYRWVVEPVTLVIAAVAITHLGRTVRAKLRLPKP